MKKENTRCLISTSKVNSVVMCKKKVKIFSNLKFGAEIENVPLVNSKISFHEMKKYKCVDKNYKTCKI